MVSFHNSNLSSDLIEDRWAHEDLGNDELWEKIEARQKKKRKWWIIATTFLFLVLSAIPIIIDRSEKWKTRNIIRKLAQEINTLKKESLLHQKNYKLTLLQDQYLGFRIEELTECDGAVVKIKHQGSFINKIEQTGHYQWFSPEQGENFNIPNLKMDFCYDPLKGNFLYFKNLKNENMNNILGYGVISVKDLSTERLDRASFLIIQGLSAEISFD